MTIHTYVVDHGNKSPRVGLNAKINGGKVIVVALGDVYEELDSMRKFIDELRDSTSCDQTKYGIDDFLN